MLQSQANNKHKAKPMSLYPLGKQAPKLDKRTLKLEDYLQYGKLPPIPKGIDWGTPVTSWPMMKNDAVGDCTIAGAGHMVQTWTANAAKSPIIIPDAQILAAYSAVGGYDPKDPSTDNGCVELDVLNYWRKTGIGGTKITAFAAVSPKRADLVKASIYLFGGLYLGVALPKSAQAQTDTGIWSVPKNGLRGDGKPGTWGGHCVPIVAFNDKFLDVITWGLRVRMTWNFFYAYCDESYSIFSPNWLKDGHAAPNGVDYKSLLKDLKLVTSA